MKAQELKEKGLRSRLGLQAFVIINLKAADYTGIF